MKLIHLIIIVFLGFACETQKNSEDTWTPLWNGQDFEGWHTYLSTPYNDEIDSLGNPIEPYGIDNDPLKAIDVVATEDGNAIKISGVVWGMIYTEKDYQNYHLKLKVKWGKGMHRPREKGPRDSGLLYHGFGEPGSAYYWMHSQELQIQQGDLGDYWPVGDVEIDVPSSLMDDTYYIYNPNGDLRTYYFADINSIGTADSTAKRRVFKEKDAELPHGEWNDVELIAFGDSSIHIVNGEVVMRLYNSRNMVSKERLDKGRIILQSEGAEVYYKEVALKSISEIPAKFRE